MTSTSRRTFLQQTGLALAAVAVPGVPAAFAETSYVSKRPIPAKRKFRSAAVDAAIENALPKIPDPKLAWLFSNCFPNALDTTVTTGTWEGKPDTVAITGDIDAMWLRDSSDSILAYVPYAAADADLRRMMVGLIRRQARCILLDPYANAFTSNLQPPPLSWAVHDSTTMKPGVAERKWEIDSLCFPILLSHAYWSATRDTSPFDAQWFQAMHLVVQTFKEQQRFNGPGPYSFQRAAENPLDTLPGAGFGAPAVPNGLIFSGFRPSDDACQYPFLIPSNLFAVRVLRQLAEMQTAIARDAQAARESSALADQVSAALSKHSVIVHPTAGRIWAYEVDGYGNSLSIDDANLPSLLSLPLLGCCPPGDELYLATRKFALSAENPYFAKGTAATGIGSPHTGQGTVWPMSIIVRALTSQDRQEQLDCLRTLKNTDAGTGFMHESFEKDDAAKFSRSWFAWANSLFGTLILQLLATDPALLKEA